MRYRGIGIFFIFLSAVAVLWPALAATGTESQPNWEPCGWGGGGYFFSAVYHPTIDGVIYMGLDVGGVCKTTDHGMTWRRINDGLKNYAVYSLATDRSNPDTVFSATEGGLHKSVDGGAHWQYIPHTSHDELRITGERNRSVRAIAIAPDNGDHVFAASPGGRVYKSTDGGMGWRVVYEQNGSGGISSVAVAAKNSSLIVAATKGFGLILSEDSGETWRPLATPIKASSAVFAESDANILYGAFFTDGVWKSIDRGATWTRCSDGIAEGASILEVAVSPTNPLDVYAIGQGVFVSKDGGKSWSGRKKLRVDRIGNPTLHYNAAADPMQVMDRATNVTINPVHPNEVFVSQDWRAGWSGDGGATWSERSRNADITCVTDIRFHQGKVYTTAMDEGLMVSEDNGNSWRQLCPLRYDANLSGHYWRVAVQSVNGDARILTTVSPWNTKLRRVVRSQDGGKSFVDTVSGLPQSLLTQNTMWRQGHPRALAVDPQRPEMVYLGLDGDATKDQPGGGIFRSDDGGAHWKQLPHQPGSRRVFYGLAVDPTDSKRIFWGANGENGGLYRSEDEGYSWSKVFSKEQWIFNILVTKEGTVYCPGKDLWRSLDHGNTWEKLTNFGSGRSICGIETDPRDPKTLWISAVTWDNSSNGAVYKSSDNGRTWQDITGNLEFVKPQILRFNPETNELWAGWVGLSKIKQ